MSESERKKLKELVVYVGGSPYPACIDAKGVLRFKYNWCVVAAHDAATREARGGIDSLDKPLQADMNALAYRFQTEQPRPSLRQYAEYHMLIGYSLDGFCELSAFSKLEVSTPQWTREGIRPWGPPKRKKKGPKS